MPANKKNIKIYCLAFRWVLLFIILVGFSSSVYADVLLPGIDPGALMNHMVTSFKDGGTQAALAVVGPSKNLMSYLFAIDMTWTGINWVLEETDFQAIVVTVTKKVLYISLLLGVLTGVEKAAGSGNIMGNGNWFATIPNSFAAVGNDIAIHADDVGGGMTLSNVPSIPGLTAGLNLPSAKAIDLDTISLGDPELMALNPGVILDGGIKLAFYFLGNVILSFMNPSIIFPWSATANLFLLVVACAVAYSMIMTFAALAADLLVNFVESYILMACGIFLIGFRA